jgi:hypothetical protein
MKLSLMIPGCVVQLTLTQFGVCCMKDMLIRHYKAAAASVVAGVSSPLSVTYCIVKAAQKLHYPTVVWINAF